jgi:adenine-specific DNA-methyltransferase
LAALVIPTSFISGPYFKKLRSHILSLSVPLELHLVEKRSDVFLDVVQDTCVLLLRKRLTDQEIAPPPNCSIVQTDGVVVSLGIVDVPLSGDRAWALPHSGNRGGCDDPFNARFSRLADYGYSAKAGYFVWNRSMDRLSDRTVPLAGEVPLVWAHNVQAGKVVEMGARSDPSLTTFVRVPADSSAMLTGETIVLQRTTNRAQQRRLVAGLVSEQAAQRYGGFVSENHTIVIVRSKDRSQLVEPRELMALLNSQPVDEMFRRFSGTVSVSTRLLRDLPLPHPTMLPGSLADSVDIDNAIAEAYLSSSAIGLEPPDPPPPSAENLPAS